MKLGFWNRLAVVLAGLTISIGPVVVMLSVASQIGEVNELSYTACIESAESLSRNWEAEIDRCSEAYLNPNLYDGVYSWSFWFENAIGFTILCGAAYAIIFASQWIVRWVLAGRERE